MSRIIQEKLEDKKYRITIPQDVGLEICRIAGDTNPIHSPDHESPCTSGMAILLGISGAVNDCMSEGCRFVGLSEVAFVRPLPVGWSFVVTFTQSKQNGSIIHLCIKASLEGKTSRVIMNGIAILYVKTQKA